MSAVSNPIEICVFSVPQPIGSWRVSGSPPTHLRRGRRLREVAFGIAAAVSINVAAGLLIESDVGSAYLEWSKRPEFTPGQETVRAFLLDGIGSTALQPKSKNASIAVKIQTVRIDAIPAEFASDLIYPDTIRDTDAVSVAVADVSTQSERERLRGIYRNQIAARLARVLEESRIRPRSCTVRLVQQVHGTISELEAPDCSADPVAQHQLLEVIQHAAPLPAPPRADVFDPILTIEIGKEVRVQLVP